MMMKSEGSWARVAAAVLAPAGVIAAHTVAFRAASSGHHDHERLLGATGHGSWWWCAALALTIAAYLIVAHLQTRSGSSRGATFVGAALTLAFVQTGAFVGLESLERISTGHGPFAILHEPAVGLGLLIQLATAAIAALLVVLFLKVARWLRTAGAPQRATGDSARPLVSIQLPVLGATRRPAAPRGPPALLLS